MSTILPAGTYYIGDPCYAVDGSDCDRFCDNADTGEGVILGDGRKAACFYTLYGDGVYRGSDGFDYGVDSGMLSAIPIESVFGCGDGNIHTFDAEFECESVAGIINFGSVVIDTAQDEDEEP